MQIIENIEAWQAQYQQNWLAHYKQTGETNWRIYNRPKNKHIPASKGIDLAKSRLALISSAGGYLIDSQSAFDAENVFGDYTLRIYPVSTAFEDITYAHNHYDHTAVDTDPQVLLPLRHLEAMGQSGYIGELAPVISYSGYQPDAVRTLQETIPAVIEFAKTEAIDAALLVPA